MKSVNTFELDKKLHRLVIGLSVVFVAGSGLAAYVAGNNVTLIMLLSAALLGLCIIGPRSRLGGVALTTGMMGQAMVLTLAFANHPWQLDAHMTFFALLAIVSLFSSVALVIWAVVIVAVHHAVLTFVLPSMVYPSADLLGNIARTGFHATVVLAEAGLMIFAIQRRQVLEKQVVDRESALEEQSAEASRAKENAVALAERFREALVLLQRRLSALADGDLREDMPDIEGEEFRDLVDDFNAALVTLSTAIVEAQRTNKSVQDVSSRMSQASEDVIGQTGTLSQTLLDMSADIDKVNTEFIESNQTIEAAVRTAQKSLETAQESGAITSRAVDAMRDIEASSKEMTDAINLIEDIAFQTQLLALNASVEASRAGDAGRGFSVVAHEINGLAGRSSTAALQIRDLIKSSGSHIDDGVGLVTEAGTRFGDIVNAISGMTETYKRIQDRIATSAGQVSQINASMDQVSRDLSATSQKGAALVDLSRNVKEDAATLDAQLDTFLLRGSSTSVEDAPEANLDEGKAA